MSSSNKGRQKQLFDGVLLAVGHHKTPHFPEPWPGQDDFQGRIIHSHSYKDHVGYEDKARRELIKERTRKTYDGIIFSQFLGLRCGRDWQFGSRCRHRTQPCCQAGREKKTILLGNEFFPTNSPVVILIIQRSYQFSIH